MLTHGGNLGMRKEIRQDIGFHEEEDGDITIPGRKLQYWNSKTFTTV